MRGLELLAIETELKREKTRTQVVGKFQEVKGVLSTLSGREIAGYEIHMGVSKGNERNSLSLLADKESGGYKVDGVYKENVYGSYVHGVFDHGEIAFAVIKALAEKKGIAYDESDGIRDYAAFKERQYDKLADELRKSLDMDYIYRLLEQA